MRVLLIPDGDQSGGGQAVQPTINPAALAALLSTLDSGQTGPVIPVQAATPAAPVQPPAPVIPEGHRLVPESQLSQLLARLDSFTQTQAQQQEAQRQAEAARLARTAENDPAKAYKELQTLSSQQLQAMQAELENVRSANSKTHKNLSINQALAARTDLVEGAAVHLAKLLETDSQLEVVQENGQYQVRTRTLQSVPDYLADLLKRPENRLFLRAQTAGGSGATQHQAAGGGQWSNDGAEAVPANLGLAIVGEFQRAREQRAAAGFDPTENRFKRAR